MTEREGEKVRNEELRYASFLGGKKASLSEADSKRIYDGASSLLRRQLLCQENNVECVIQLTKDMFK